jgi:hypothetical protein
MNKYEIESAMFHKFIIFKAGIDYTRKTELLNFYSFKEPRGVDSKESILPAFLARAHIFKPSKEPRNLFPARRNRFLGLLNVYTGSGGPVRQPLSTGSFLDCSYIPAQN